MGWPKKQTIALPQTPIIQVSLTANPYPHPRHSAHTHTHTDTETNTLTVTVTVTVTVTRTRAHSHTNKLTHTETLRLTLTLRLTDTHTCSSLQERAGKIDRERERGIKIERYGLRKIYRVCLLIPPAPLAKADLAGERVYRTYFRPSPPLDKAKKMIMNDFN